MNRIEIEVMTPGSALESFSRTWNQLESGESTVPRLAFGSMKELFSAITQKRLEMIRFVAAHGEMNTRQLSQHLERNYKNVYQDVKALVELGLLDKSEAGALSAPFDEIVIHAPVRDAA
ncbi:MAG: ArsR family transcriptional regulator [Proteobacteria bacterium]|nr:ArsR family transcriptional regulator [Pseudomonadota bacterium]